MDANASIDEFLNALAAKQPTPGGGSASALGGAIGAALGSMAANYTVGNEKYAAFNAAAREALGKLEALRAGLLALMQADMAAYDGYRAAVAMAKNSAEEKAARSAALGAAREASTVVPERILAAVVDGLEVVDGLSRAVNPNLAGDVASAAYFLEACGRGAAIQVLSNCVNDAARRQGAEAAVARCEALRVKIHATVQGLLKIPS